MLGTKDYACQLGNVNFMSFTEGYIYDDQDNLILLPFQMHRHRRSIENHKFWASCSCSSLNKSSDFQQLPPYICRRRCTKVDNTTRSDNAQVNGHEYDMQIVSLLTLRCITKSGRPQLREDVFTVKLKTLNAQPSQYMKIVVHHVQDLRPRQILGCYPDFL